MCAPMHIPQSVFARSSHKSSSGVWSIRGFEMKSLPYIVSPYTVSVTIFKLSREGFSILSKCRFVQTEPFGRASRTDRRSFLLRQNDDNEEHGLIFSFIFWGGGGQCTLCTEMTSTTVFVGRHWTLGEEEDVEAQTSVTKNRQVRWGVRGGHEHTRTSKELVQMAEGMGRWESLEIISSI